MDLQATEHLKELIKKYPYFHPARVLLLQALHKHFSPSFDKELRKNAVMVPSRNSLFHLIEESHYKINEGHHKYNSDSFDNNSDRTSNLISDFLNKQPQALSPQYHHPIDASQDYISFLLQTEQDDEKLEIPLNGGGVIEDYLELTEEEKKLELHTEVFTPLPIEVTKTEGNGNNEILTEVMARIYIKQGKYENAIKIIQQLSLIYPKKNRYFADQIRFLEKLIINNKNKK